MSSSLNNQFDDQMVVLNHYYPDVYTQVASVQGSETKPRRRRKNNKAESNSGFRKRKLSDEQVNMLELHFQNEHKLESERKDRLAAELGLDPRQVAVWFQNRRTRYKSKKLEEEYSRLKSEHENAVFEKCQLKTEVLKLKERLSENEEKMQKLLEQSNGASSNSPSSSFSAEIMEPPFLGGFGMEGLESVFCVTGNNYDTTGMEYWHNFYDM
ncbi:hypothetical protein ACET3Z_027113 [Daucus carota]